MDARVLWLAGAAAVLAFAPPSAAYELEGRVQLEQGRRAVPAREMRKVLVAYRPDRAAPVEPSDEPLEMATINKDFFPEQLVVPQGSEVVFPNYDKILHNVFSVSGRNRFDLGLYGKGEGKAHRFTAPGLVRVYCNVHRDMFANILVVDTPFNGSPDDQGAFRIEDLPVGLGTLTVWHPQSEVEEVRVAVPRRTPLVVTLELAGRKIPAHLNKFGRPYGRSRDRY